MLAYKLAKGKVQILGRAECEELPSELEERSSR